VTLAVLSDRESDGYGVASAQAPRAAGDFPDATRIFTRWFCHNCHRRAELAATGLKRHRKNSAQPAYLGEPRLLLLYFRSARKTASDPTLAYTVSAA